MYTKRTLLWILWAVNLVVVLAFWSADTGNQWLAGNLDTQIAFGRLAGLLATFSALTQFILMGRTGWLESIFGMDRLARAHRLNGYAVFTLMVAHVVLITGGYAALLNIDFLAASQKLGDIFQYITLARLALFALIIVVISSIYIARKHLKFEWWYWVHLLTYLAIVLVPFHQLANGGDLQQGELFRYYWIGLYAFTALNIVVWRFGRPLYRFWKFRFRVQEVRATAPRATSVYITGQNMQSFTARGGQFVLVRFLAKDMWWQEHPFSLSMLPDGEKIRLTIRQLGDFTNQIPNLKPGTPVIVSGPHGAFTAQQAVANKRLYIAGGVGITPIRSIIQERAKQYKLTAQPKPQPQSYDDILIYANRTESEIIFKDELSQLAANMNMYVHHVLSDQADYQGEKGIIDQQRLERLVPDITERDVFLCGPPPMMAGVLKALRSLGVPKRQIHFESFSLHGK